MKKILNKNTFFELFMIALGCAIYALSLDMISVPNKLADGGLSGIALLLRHFWGINMGLTTLVLNIPLIILGYRFMGKRLLAYTIWGYRCSFLLLIILAPSTNYNATKPRTRPLPFRRFSWDSLWLRTRIGLS